MEYTPADSGNSASIKPLLQIKDGKPLLNILVSSLNAYEWRLLVNLMNSYGNSAAILANDSLSMDMKTKESSLYVVPNRLVNFRGQYGEDSLLDDWVIQNSFLKKKKPMLFLGKSGLFNIKRDVGQSYQILSEELKTKGSSFKTELTKEGRELLGIPEHITDKIFLNVSDVRLPIIACIPDDAIILATVKSNGKRYCAAYHDKKNNITCYFANNEMVVPDNSWLYQQTGVGVGSLLLNYILKFLTKGQ